MSENVIPLVGKNFELQVGIEATPGTAVPATRKIEYLTEGLTTNTGKSEDFGIRGSLQRHKSNSQLVRTDHNGSLQMLLKHDDLNFFAEAIFGASDGTYAQEAKTMTFEMTRGTKTYIYTGVKVDEARFEFTSGEAIKMTLDLLAFDKSEGSKTAALSYGTDIPMTMDAATLSIDSEAREFHSMTFGVRRALDKDHFVNSIDRTSAVSTEYTPYGSVELDYSEDTIDIFPMLEGGNTYPIVVGVTDGANPVTFTCANATLTGDIPAGDDMSVLKFPFEFTGLSSGADDALAVTGLT